MSIFDRTRNLEMGAATYEWHGRPEQRLIVDPEALMDSTPVCSSCMGRMERAPGGFWCGSCETASL